MSALPEFANETLIRIYRREWMKSLKSILMAAYNLIKH